MSIYIYIYRFNYLIIDLFMCLFTYLFILRPQSTYAGAALRPKYILHGHMER